MKATLEPLHTIDEPTLLASVEKVTGRTSRQVLDNLAIEEPLEIQLSYGPSNLRQTRSISVTMRTPGNDFDLAAGFLMTEGVIRDANDIEQITHAGQPFAEGEPSTQTMETLKLGSKQNIVRVELAPDVEVGLATLQRNFYTTSSCGICGKASLVALQTVCPPRMTNNFRMQAQLLYRLPSRLRASQGVFDRTGGLSRQRIFAVAG